VDVLLGRLHDKNIGTSTRFLRRMSMINHKRKILYFLDRGCFLQRWCELLVGRPLKMCAQCGSTFQLLDPYP